MSGRVPSGVWRGMSRQRKIGQHVVMYLGWAAVVALGIWLGLVGREAVLNLLSIAYVKLSRSRAWQVAALDKFVLLGLGLAWITLMIGSEHYLREGVKKGLLFPRLAGFLGVEVVLIALADAIRLIVVSPVDSVWIHWLIILAEALAGAILLWAARTRAVRERGARPAVLGQASSEREG